MNDISFTSALGFVFSSRVRSDEISTEDAIILLDSLLQIFATNPVLASSSRRQLTFLHWPLRATCQHLARAAPLSGFYHTGRDDETVCVSCGIGLKSWSSRDSVQVQHHLVSPNCPYLAALSVLDSKTAALHGCPTKAVRHNIEANLECFEQIHSYLSCSPQLSMSGAADKKPNSPSGVPGVGVSEARDSISNALGLGHGAAIIALAAYLHYNYLSNKELPANTVDLLKTILLIEEKMELVSLNSSSRSSSSSPPVVMALTEDDLPPFQRFVHEIVCRANPARHWQALNMAIEDEASTSFVMER